MDFIASKMKCPVCGAKLNAGSDRFAVITPSDPRDRKQQYEEYFYILIFYCTKDDSHTFGILERARPTEKKEAE